MDEAAVAPRQEPAGRSKEDLTRWQQEEQRRIAEEAAREMTAYEYDGPIVCYSAKYWKPRPRAPDEKAATAYPAMFDFLACFSTNGGRLLDDKAANVTC